VLYCTLKSLSRATPASCCALNACVFRGAAVVWCIVNTPCHLALAMRPARRNCSDVNAALRRCTFCPVCVAAPRSPHRGCATAQRYLTLVRFDRACLCVPLHARTYCCRWRRQSRSPCCAQVRHRPSDRACRSRGVPLLQCNSDCDTVLQVSCVRGGCARRANCGRVRVCNATRRCVILLPC
jgi:hypothetical protein